MREREGTDAELFDADEENDQDSEEAQEGGGDSEEDGGGQEQEPPSGGQFVADSDGEPLEYDGQRVTAAPTGEKSGMDAIVDRIWYYAGRLVWPLGFAQRVLKTAHVIVRIEVKQEKCDGNGKCIKKYAKKTFMLVRTSGAQKAKGALRGKGMKNKVAVVMTPWGDSDSKILEAALECPKQAIYLYDWRGRRVWPPPDPISDMLDEITSA